MDNLKERVQKVFLNEKGWISSAASKYPTEESLKLLDEIKSQTCFLDVLNPSDRDRITSIILGILEIPKCESCGKQLNVFKRYKDRLFGKVCSVQCSGFKHMGVEGRKKSVETYKNNLIKFKEDFYNDHILEKYELMADDVFNTEFDIFIKKKDDGGAYHLVAYNDYQIYKNLLHAVLKKTENMIPLVKDEFSWSPRFHILNKKMIGVPKCFCGVDVGFIDFQLGFREFCSKSCMRKSAKNGTVRERTSNTNMIKYGGLSPLCSKEVRSKFENTLQANFGVGVLNPGQLLRGRPKVIENFYNEMMTDDIRNGGCELLSGLDELLNREVKFKYYKFKCKKCQIVFEDYLLNGHVPECPQCHPMVPKSEYEVEIIRFIRNFYDGVILRSNRSVLKNLELDIYIPDKKLAIEFDGLYWHSENAGKNRMYHIDKTERCREHGIRLIHVFEDEWINKRRIVENRLKHIMGCSRFSVGARECEIRKIDSQLKNKFLIKYHIQGKDNSSYKVGAFHKGRLVGVMTFGGARVALGSAKEDGKWELMRFCTLGSFNFPGMADRLLKFFIREVRPRILYSYADLRWSEGGLYKNLGFDLDHSSGPNYWYLDSKMKHVRFHRYNFRKSELKHKLEKFDENLSEWDNMKNNGFNRIWDCGNLVFIKRYEGQKFLKL